MNAIVKRIQKPTTTADLREAGFTSEQIQRLEQLQSFYPWIEFIDSNQQWHRLILMRWLYIRGKIATEDH